MPGRRGRPPKQPSSPQPTEQPQPESIWFGSTGQATPEDLEVLKEAARRFGHVTVTQLTPEADGTFVERQIRHGVDVTPQPPARVEIDDGYVPYWLVRLGRGSMDAFSRTQAQVVAERAGAQALGGGGVAPPSEAAADQEPDEGGDSGTPTDHEG